MKEWPLIIAWYPTERNRNATPLLPEGFTDWTFWNYTDKGDPAEFGTGSGPVVLYVYNGTPAEMGQWLGINAFSILNRATNEVIPPKQAVQVTSPNGIAFSLDGSYLAVAEVGDVKLLNSESGEEITTLSVNGRSALSLSFLPDGNALVIGTDDGTVLLWDLSFLKSAEKKESMIDIACSRVQQNFTEAEWAQYVGIDVPYEVTCSQAPVP
jgi:WD40 repeat protein